MKQTAIEWLIEQYIEKLTLTPAMVEQAKAMEKEQIRKAYLADAYKNVIDGVTMQASTIMPAFKDLFAQGKNAREVLSPWINTRAQVLGIPADQIKVSDMYDIGSGATPISRMRTSSVYGPTSTWRTSSR